MSSAMCSSEHIGKYFDASWLFMTFQGETLDDLPEAVVQDCAQLVKANSIQGNAKVPVIQQIMLRLQNILLPALQNWK